MARQKSVEAEVNGTAEAVQDGPVAPAPVHQAGSLLTLKQAAVFLGLKPARVRRLMAGENPTIHGTQQEIEGTSIKVWRVPYDELVAYKAKPTTAKTRKSSGTRAGPEGGKQYIIRLTQEQFATVRPMLEANGVELESRYRNRKKGKADAAAAEEAASQNGAAPTEAVSEQPVASEEVNDTESSAETEIDDTVEEVAE